MNSWNDRMLNALEGRPERGDGGGLTLSSGLTAGTLQIPATAYVHHFWMEGHNGDASATFPNGTAIDVKNGQFVNLDFKGLLAGGDYVFAGAGVHYMVSWLPAK